MAELLSTASQWGPEWFLILALVGVIFWQQQRANTILLKLAEERGQTRSALEQVARALHSLSYRIKGGG